MSGAAPTHDRSTWTLGLRVRRKDRDELGTVTATLGNEIKVTWDSGRTSYYRNRDEANVELIPER